jgi:hypothetical protein
MAYGIVSVFEGVTENLYWDVNAKLGINRDGTGDWPVGLRSHFAGPTGTGWLVVELWDSKVAQETFMTTTLGAVLAASNIAAPAQVIETDTVSTHPV